MLVLLSAEVPAFDLGDPFATRDITPERPALRIDEGILPCQVPAFELAVASAQRNQSHVALLFIDLDGFKDANDRFGHAVGDQLLVELGARLRAAMRANDTVARFGGDEFVCLLCDVASEDDVQRIADKLLLICSTPFAIEGKTVEVSASMGIGFHPVDGKDFETLLAHADASMYRAKADGKNGHCRISDREQ